MKVRHVGIILFLLAFAFETKAVTIYVNTNNTPPGAGTELDPYTTITNAMARLAVENAAVTGGHVIAVAQGTFTNQVTFTPDHQGSNGAPNTIEGTDYPVISGVTGSGIYLTNCPWIVISGMRIENITGAGIQIGNDTGDSDNIAVTNCIVGNCSSYGIYSGSSHTGLKFDRCIVYNCTKIYSAGFYFVSSCDVVVNHCIAVGNHENGFEPGQGTTLILKNSIAIGNGLYGIEQGHYATTIKASFNCIYGNGLANYSDYYHTNRLNTADEINALPYCSNNIVANPGFSNLTNDWDFSQLYADSVCLNAGDDGSDIGAYENPGTVPASANTYYVSPAGDDGDTGLSGHPWATIVHAATVAKAGDTVIVNEGSYTGQVTIAHGGSGDPVIYQTSGSVKVDGNSGTYGFYLDRVGDVILDGFEVTNCVNGIYYNFGFSNTIQNCRIANNTYGIQMYRNPLILIEDTTVCSNTAHGIFFNHRSYGGVVRRCRIFGQSGANDAGMYTTTGATGYGYPRLVSNCDIFGNWHGAYLQSPNNMVVENCVIYGNSKNGLWVAQGPVAYVKNCIIANNDTGLYEAHSAGEISSCNNCFWNNTTAHYFNNTPNSNLTTVAEINALTDALCTNNIECDPLFLDAANGDFRLDRDSLCVNAGTNDVEATVDMYGNTRQSGPAVDIGSYEYIPLPAGTVFMFW